MDLTNLRSDTNIILNAINGSDVQSATLGLDPPFVGIISATPIAYTRSTQHPLLDSDAGYDNILVYSPTINDDLKFVVNSTADETDLIPGNGIVDTQSGNITLRAAIVETNALAGPQTITLPAGTYTLGRAGINEDAADTGDLDISDDLTIVGADAATTIIDADSIDRVFQVISGATFNLSGVTVTGGSLTNSMDGGGIFNAGTLHVDDVIVRDNQVSGSVTALGGGIFNQSTLTVTGSQFLNNTAQGSGGGIFNTIGTATIVDTLFNNNTASSRSGGGLDNQGDGTVNVSGSTFTNNVASDNGGGMRNFGGIANVTNSTFSTNRVSTGTSGGGLANDDDGVLTITDSTISGNSGQGAGGIRNAASGVVNVFGSTLTGNTATSSGGAIINQDSGVVNISNSTLSGNSSGTNGGGIHNAGTGSVTLVNSTIASNTATGTGGGIYSSTTLNLLNTIVATNTGGAGPDINGAVTSQGHNLIGNVGNATGVVDGTNGDKVGGGANPTLIPLLGSLRDNGGPTFTHALLPNSPAIDAGDNTDVAATDQRGVTRIADGDADGTATVDIGALEFLPNSLVVDSFFDTVDANPGDGVVADTNGNRTLRAAIMEANALAGKQTLLLVAGTYTLSVAGTNEDVAATGDLDITSDLEIIGVAALASTIDAAQLDRVFDVRTGATLTFESVTLTRGMVTGGEDGGAIRNAGTLNVTRATLTGNMRVGSSTAHGGAIYNVGTTDLLDVQVSNNTAAGGGGGLMNDGGVVRIHNSTFNGNLAGLKEGAGSKIPAR